jgi:CTP-dependent riboflavin kinase
MINNIDDKYLIKNTVWFKSFNEDYRNGGRYNSLEPSEFKVIVILQSYSNSHGEVRKEVGGGYSLSTELTKMLDMTYKTVIKCLMSLEEKKMITVDAKTNVITLEHFVIDNGYRYSGGIASGRARKNMAIQSQETASSVKKTNEELAQLKKVFEDKFNIVEKGTGVIIGGAE